MNLNRLVGLGRVELPTSRLSGVRSNQLSYRPSHLLSCAIFAAKKSHTTKECVSVLTVDAPEGRVASVAIICLRSTEFKLAELSKELLVRDRTGSISEN